MIDPYDLADDDTGTVSWAGVDDATADLRGALKAAQERAERAEAAIKVARGLADRHEDRCGTSIHAWSCDCRFGDIRAVLNRALGAEPTA